MAFNSFAFLLFFPSVVVLYYALGGGKFCKYFLLLAGYYFYANIKPVFLLLLLAITLLSYIGGLLVEKCPKQKKTTLTVSLILIFSSLFVFKYLGFFNESIRTLLNIIGIGWDVPYLNLMLPIGISFYTFQASGYIIDVYRGKIQAERDYMIYSLFVSFFPVILAGPIQRSYNLIPQLKEKHKILYDNVIGGLKMMLWGFFMKLCVADRLGIYVDSVFNNVDAHNGTSILLASLFFTIQIYSDFAGYSLIAISCAKILGFQLPDNFRHPYFSLTFKEFWKRWHIALSTWFGDYLYIPLGGNRVKFNRYLLNLMIVFLVSGLWHGAAWTFVIWGGIHGIYQVYEAVQRKYWGQKDYKVWYSRAFKILIVFLLANLAWIFFRANTTEDAFTAVTKIFANPGKPFLSPMAMLFGLASTSLLFAKDFADEFYPRLRLLNSENMVLSVLSNAILMVYVILFGVLDNSQFIYFQF